MITAQEARMMYCPSEYESVLKFVENAIVSSAKDSYDNEVKIYKEDVTKEDWALLESGPFKRIMKNHGYFYSVSWDGVTISWLKGALL